MAHTADPCRVFRQLHQSGCFVMPNPWDIGSARLLTQFGFPALATTSSGFGWTLGRLDNRGSLAETLAHIRSIAQAVAVPVNADFQSGYATEPVEVGTNVSVATGTGIAGLSIEDSTGNAASPLYDLPLAVERIQAARRAIDDSGTGILLTGRSEGFVVGRPDLDDPSAYRVRRARGGLPVRTRYPRDGGHRGGGERARSQTRQRAGRQRFYHCGRAYAAGGPADQRRRRTGPGGVDGIAPGGEGNSRSGDFCESGQCPSLNRNQPRGHA